MSFEDQLTPEERNVEARLRRLIPPPHAIERDAVMFRAGQRAGRRQMARRLGIVSLAVGMVAVWWPRQSPMVAHQDETSSRAAAEPASRIQPQFVRPRPLTDRHQEIAGSRSGYLRLRTEVITLGTDVLRSPPSVAAEVSEVPSMEDWPAWVSTGSPGV